MDAFSTKRKKQQHYNTTGDFNNSPASYSKQTQRKRNILSKQEVFRMLAPQLDPLPRRIGRHNLAAWMLLESPIVLIPANSSSSYSRRSNSPSNYKPPNSRIASAVPRPSTATPTRLPGMA
uniref:(northern house mosquito) hypothetical protein n=1 Tax=Culex pipiens TaxID=7175 RepID=A0A8D8EVY3_CULPI